MRSRRSSGFTLVELLVVVLIVGLLSAIAVPVFNGQRKKGKDGQTKATIAGTLHSIVGVYASDERWPNPSQIITRMASEEPSVNYRAYVAGTSESTGPRDISLTVEDAAMITMCAKSTSGEVFCTRRDGLSLLPTGVFASTGVDLPVVSLFLPETAVAADDTSDGTMAYSHAATEPIARGKLPTRSMPDGQQWIGYPVYEPANTGSPSSPPAATTPTTTSSSSSPPPSGTTNTSPTTSSTSTGSSATAATQEPANSQPCLPDRNRGHGNDCFHYDPDNPGNGGGGGNGNGNGNGNH